MMLLKAVWLELAFDSNFKCLHGWYMSSSMEFFSKGQFMLSFTVLVFFLLAGRAAPMGKMVVDEITVLMCFSWLSKDSLIWKGMVSV